jgi:hypothetical protein
MTSLSYAHHRFPPTVIQHAVWLYLRFCLSYRDMRISWRSAGSTFPMRLSVAGSPSSGRGLLGNCVDDDRAQAVAGTWTRWS